MIGGLSDDKLTKHYIDASTNRILLLKQNSWLNIMLPHLFSRPEYINKKIKGVICYLLNAKYKVSQCSLVM